MHSHSPSPSPPPFNAPSRQTYEVDPVVLLRALHLRHLQLQQVAQGPLVHVRDRLPHLLVRQQLYLKVGGE